MALPVASVLALTIIWFVLTPLRFRLRREGRKHWGQAVKGFSSLIAAGFAAWACFRGNWADPYAVTVLAALLTCVLADVTLDYFFVPGGVLFFLGHVLYVAALLNRATPEWWSFAIFALAYIGLFFFFLRYRDTMPRKMLPGVLLYGVALSALFAMALTAAILTRTWPAALGALGATLFLTSDMTLGHCLLRNCGDREQKLCLRQYYAGQLLLALSAHATLLF